MQLYDQIGGDKGVEILVDRFYRKVLMDGRVSHFFDRTDMQFLYQHQKKFLTTALGGPDIYDGRDLRTAHQDLVENRAMNESHFNIVADHLNMSIMELGIPDDVRTKIMEIVASTKDQVLGR